MPVVVGERDAKQLLLKADSAARHNNVNIKVIHRELDELAAAVADIATETVISGCSVHAKAAAAAPSVADELQGERRWWWRGG
jgi:hypothetical protein